MNDLISRSELLKAMNTWDKFGCNEHSRLVRLDSNNNEEYVPYVHYEDMVNCVKNMPTAYSVAKVVEDLREMKNAVKLIKDYIGSHTEIVYDNINHPTYYANGNIEVWDFIKDKNLNYDRGCAIKYICRAGLKDKNKEIEDLKKAVNYLNHEIKHLEKEKEN